MIEENKLTVIFYTALLTPLIVLLFGAFMYQYYSAQEAILRGRIAQELQCKEETK